MSQSTMSISDMACEILQKTQDGDKLAPQHLKLLEGAVNGALSEKGEVAFYELYENVKTGYRCTLCFDPSNTVPYRILPQCLFLYWEFSEQ